MSLNKFTIQKSFAISAGAGSGKTYALSRRYINALLGFDYFREDYKTQESHFETLKPAKVKQIVTITYTEAAALEMKGRIFELVAKIIDPNLDSNDEDYDSIQKANENISDSEREYVQETLTQAFRESSNAKISTIHAYCLDIIKVNADIARIDTKLDIINDDEKSKELSNIIFEVLNAKKNKETVLDVSKNISMFFIDGLINKYVSSSKFRKDYDSFHKGSISEAEYKELIYELYPLPNVDTVLEELQDDVVRLNWFNTYYERIVNFDAVVWNKVNPDEKAPSLGAKKFPETDAVKKELEKLVQHYVEIDREKEDLFFDKIEKIKSLLLQIKSRYDERLEALGKIDFDMIITKALEIMPDVQTDFRYIMVDEFQDTNEAQFNIVRNSMNDKTNLFVVGDSKQSIYSFQGAEIEVFNNAVHNTELFSSIEDMSVNHRSDGIVLDTVNRIFEVLLQKDENLKIISHNYEAEAQALMVSKSQKQKKGSFKYLITSQEYEGEVNEMDTIVQFISDICRRKLDDYRHITDLIDRKQEAVAIVFDSSTKMLELKQKLREQGISAKVSASDNFYHTKEINDIFNVLKAIDILSRKPDKLSDHQKYYVVGAMRSNILRVDDNRIMHHIDSGSVDEKLLHYVEILGKLSLSQTVKYIYDNSNIMGVYAHFDDVDQRVANLYKFLTFCQEYEKSGEADLYHFLLLIENAIYFSEAREDEAFFKSKNTKSIELCTIHATKGLAYPLVLLANTDKGLYSQISSDALKHNNFTMNGKKKEIVGFKIDDYTPLSHRVLKQIDKMKHLAEKKRLLYVTLTRAKHDVIISAYLKEKKDGGITLRKDSYLSMIIDALGINIETLFEKSYRDCIGLDVDMEFDVVREPVVYVDHSLKAIEFVSKKLESATTKDDENTKNEVNIEATKLGTFTHEIIERYWWSFNENQNAILDKMGVYDIQQRKAIVDSMQKFYKSHVYSLLENGVEHYFELEFNHDDKTGFIDFIYFDKEKNGWVIVDFKTGIATPEKEVKYQKQLDFYQSVLEELGYIIAETKLLWL